MGSGKNLWDRADPCRSGSCGGACLSSSLCFEEIKWGGPLQVMHCKVYNMGHCCLPITQQAEPGGCMFSELNICNQFTEDACRLFVLCVPCLTLLVDQQGTAQNLS